MEIMLVLYRTMESLGMQWCPKAPLPSMSRALNEDIFYVQTQCILCHHKVCMDLQLYRVADQSYLVDFRNVGYALASPTCPKGSSSISSSSVALRRDTPSPFLFFDAVFRLIVALAGGGS